MIDIDKRTESVTTSNLSEASLPIGVDSISHIIQKLNDLGLQLSNDNIINWLPNNRNHPRNWPLKHKLANTACIFLLDTIRCVIPCTGTWNGNQVINLLGYLLNPTKCYYRIRRRSFSLFFFTINTKILNSWSRLHQRLQNMVSLKRSHSLHFPSCTESVKPWGALSFRHIQKLSEENRYSYVLPSCYRLVAWLLDLCLPLQGHISDDLSWVRPHPFLLPLLWAVWRICGSPQPKVMPSTRGSCQRGWESL